MPMAPSILVVTGEASGDSHAARMVTELKTIAPEVQVFAVGGQQLRAAGAELLFDSADLAVMGLLEVLKSYRRIRSRFREVLAFLDTCRPDLLVLVDYPGFNLKLAKAAKSRGIRVYYYISPKIWAWRAGRIHAIARDVDHMGVLFPFEVPIYQQAKVPVTCLGHPLVDAVQSTLSPIAAKQRFQLKPDTPVVGLFPGSRRSEISALLPVFLAAAARLSQQRAVQFVLPLAPTIDPEWLAVLLQQSPVPVQVVPDAFYPLIQACDAIVCASGTVTLEIALLGVPHFITYRLHPISFWLLKRLVKVPYVGLCNLITGRNVVLELLQDAVQADRLAQELALRLDYPEVQTDAQQLATTIRQALGPSGGAKNAAAWLKQAIQP